MAVLLPVANKYEYHLLDCDRCEVVKTARWQPAHKGIETRVWAAYNPYLAVYNTSYDFNPEGNLIAIIDARGQLLLSDVESGKLVYNEQMEQQSMGNSEPMIIIS